MTSSAAASLDSAVPATKRLFGPGIFPVLAVSAFLPYLHKGTGLRYENLIGSVLALAALGIVLVRGRLQKVFIPTLLLSTALFALVIASTVLGPTAPGMLKSGLGRWDHYSRPVAILLVAAVAYHGSTHEELEHAFQRSIWILLLGVSLNGLLQCAQMATDVSAILNPFLPDASAGWTVASVSAANNRLTGIFNQPLEHGLVYGVALLSCVYCWRNGRVSPLMLLTSTILIFVGGLLAFSKVFLVVAVPLAVLQALVQGGVRLRHIAGAIIGVAAVAVAASILLTQWAGAEAVYALFRMLGDPQMILLALSGGRLGKEGNLGQEIIVANTLAAFRQSPLFGVGTASGAILRDNEYLMTLAECGIVGIFFLFARFAALLLPLVGRGWRHPAAPFFASLVLLAFIGGQGGPVSGIPRSGTILWVFLAQLMMLVSSGTRRNPVR